MLKPSRVLLLGAAVIGMLVILAAWSGTRADKANADVVTVERGGIRASLTENGRLRAADSMTYRSPIDGRELEISFLAPEGLQVAEGDLIVRLDATGLTRDLERAEQAHRQAQLEEQVIRVELRDAEAANEDLGAGEPSLDVEEAAVALRLAERREERARREHEELKPLLQSGYITRDELERSALELEQAAAATRLARRRLQTVERDAGPRARARADLRMSQQRARHAHAQQQIVDAAAAVEQLRRAVNACSVYATRPGLVLYEEYLNANPRRKIRVGDRVTASFPIVTIPDVSRMLVESSVREVDVHRIAAGQSAAIRFDAFPNLSVTGSVMSVGALARGSVERPFEGRRFDILLALNSPPAELRPEMTARVEIRLAERADALRIPINAVFDGPSGEKIALLVRGTGSDTRVLKLGVQDDLHYEVLAGVEAGDRVRLNTASAPSMR